MRRFRGTVALLVCLTCLGSSSCVVKRRLITRRGSKTAQPVLMTAQASDLVQRLVDEYNGIHDLNATVDMTPALGSTEKSRVTEYKDIRGYVLFRKPDDIRIIGLYPVIRNTAFDMVSTGIDFKLYVPAQNRFLVGTNTVERPSPNKLENLRPYHFLDALLVRPIGDGAKTLLENYTDEDNAFYILHVVHEEAGGHLVLERTIWFSRVDLRLSRQIILDREGNILTDARYSDWGQFDTRPFPRHIEIDRPRDEYAVVLDVQKIDINHGVPDDRFVLMQPEGTKLQTVGQAPASPPASPDNDPGRSNR